MAARALISILAGETWNPRGTLPVPRPCPAGADNPPLPAALVAQRLTGAQFSRKANKRGTRRMGQLAPAV